MSRSSSLFSNLFNKTLLLVLLSQSAFGQFSITENKVTLRIYNKNYQLVRNAIVIVNGYEMKQCTTCKEYNNHEYWYELEMPHIKSFIPSYGKVKLQFTHPDYQPIDDSIYLTGDYFYVLGKNDDYVYTYNKRPFIIHPNYYFVEGGDSVQFTSCMKELRIFILYKFFYCGDPKLIKMGGGGPLIYIIKVPSDEAFQNLCKLNYFNFGLLISRDTNVSAGKFSGISNRISFMAKNISLKKEIEAFLKTMPEVEWGYIDSNVPTYYEIAIKQKYIDHIISITEKLLNSGYFQMPNNELMVYECLSG